MSRSFGWLDVQRIGQELADRYAGVDPFTVRFTHLRQMIEQLPGFVADPAHPVNERILEAVQMAWRDESDDAAPPADADSA